MDASSKPEPFLFTLIPLERTTTMANRQIGFIDDFPIEDVVMLKNLILNGIVNARADFLAVENVANYAAGKLLPDSALGAIASKEAVMLSDAEILAVCDQAIGATDSAALTALPPDFWKNLLQAALQMLPMFWSLL